MNHLEERLASVQKELQAAEYAIKHGAAAGGGGRAQVRGRSRAWRMVRQAIAVVLIAIVALAFIPRAASHVF